MVRRRLRALATIWIAFQAVALSALVPPSCCLGLRTSAAAASAAPCPMHESHADGHHHSAPPSKPAPECAMRAACGNQAAALFAALSTVGVLDDASVVFHSDSATLALSTHEQLIQRFQPPDAPPPRA